MSESNSEFETTLAEAFVEAYDADADVAADAAAKAAAFREDWAEDLTAERVIEAVAEAPYDDFDHRFDRAVGSLAADDEDCTDSRQYRLAGYDDLTADPEIGA